MSARTDDLVDQQRYKASDLGIGKCRVTQSLQECEPQVTMTIYITKRRNEMSARTDDLGDQQGCLTILNLICITSFTIG